KAAMGVSTTDGKNYMNALTDIRDYEHTVWHELSHEINKNIIHKSPKLQKEISDIFYTPYELTAEQLKNAKTNKYARPATTLEDLGAKTKRGFLRDLYVISQSTPGDVAKGIHKDRYAAAREMEYITDPTETWAFLSTNLRQDLMRTGVFKDYNDVLTAETLEKISKDGNTIFGRFEPYIKDKGAFIKLFNKMTLSIAPAALYLQSQQKQQDSDKEES